MKTWEDIERAALHDPILAAVVHQVRVGLMTREQALLEAAVMLSGLVQSIRSELINRIERECPDLTRHASRI
jgi:hypothetical protein